MIGASSKIGILGHMGTLPRHSLPLKPSPLMALVFAFISIFLAELHPFEHHGDLGIIKFENLVGLRDLLFETKCLP